MDIPNLIKMRARLQEMMWTIEAELGNRLKDTCPNCVHKPLCFDSNFGMFKPDVKDSNNCLRKEAEVAEP